MAVRAEKSNPVSPDAEHMLLALESVRERTLALVSHLDDRDLQRVHSPLMSPLVWDLAHIAAYEDLWLAHRHGGEPLLRSALADVYDAFETPRAIRGDVEILGPDDTRAYLREVRERTRAVIADRGTGDGTICEMVLRHELQHTETMRQTMDIAGLLPAGEPALTALAGEDGEWVEIPAGPFLMGASEAVFSYDNERPRHAVDVPAYRIARRPVSNASWLRFSEGGGYERREWWSQEGWAWKQEYDITHHPAIADGRPEASACHISWFEADAYARSRGARLPTEAEWEKAATWGQGSEGQVPAPDVAPGELGADARDVRSAGTALAGVGQVWEWTASCFGGYPGFVAHPYREYSEVFFGEDYRVLRGGAWATHPRVATSTFRNWDLPQRRQIFAGLRLAEEAR